MAQLRKGVSVLLLLLAVTVPAIAQQDLLPLHLEIGSVSILRMPSWVALNEGIYKKNGLDVDQCVAPNVQEYLDGIGVKAPKEYLCPANRSGANPPPAPITMVGGLPSFIGQVLNPQLPKRVSILTTSNVTAWPIYARKDITSVEQLKGKRIAVASFTDIHGYQVMILAHAMGWDPKLDVNLVERNAGPAAIRDLQSGKVDAVMADETAQWVAIQAGYKPLVDLRGWMVPMASGSANVEFGWLQKNRETARRFVKAQVEARAVMEHDRGAFNRALAKYFNITDSKMQDFFYSYLDTLPRKPYPAREGIRRAMQLYDGFFPQLRTRRIEEFVDDSFVRELDQSGFIDSLYKK